MRAERIYVAIIDKARSHVEAIIGIQDQVDFQVVTFRVSWRNILSQVRNWRRSDLFRRCIKCWGHQIADQDLDQEIDIKLRHLLCLVHHHLRIARSPRNTCSWLWCFTCRVNVWEWPNVAVKASKQHFLETVVCGEMRFWICCRR